MNVTIYLETLKKILKRKFFMFVLFCIAFLMPLALVLNPEGPNVSSGEGWDAFLSSALVALFVVTTSNMIGNALSVGGRSDYMPLIVTRPIHRFQYVIAKWLALATIIAVVSLIQHTMFVATGAFARWGMTEEMIMLGFVERIVSALCVSSVLTLIYLMPTQPMVLIGIIAFEFATIFSMFASSFSIPLSETSGGIANLTISILGIDEWLKTSLLPAIFGGSATDTFSQYLTVFTNLSYFLAPQVHVYDIVNARPFQWSPVLEAVSNTFLALTLATAVLNAREYHYDSD